LCNHTLHRAAYTAVATEEVEWSSSDSDRGRTAPQIQVARSWGHSAARQLTVFAEYWIVNKTGVALWYKAKLLKGSSSGAGSSNGNKRYAVVRV
jgi:hypothetical protein